MRKLIRNKKGQGLVEYGILVGGVALVGLAATAILGHKTTDLIGTVAAALPSAHAGENAPIVSGQLVATINEPGSGGLVLDATATQDFSTNLGINGEGLVVEPGGDDD